ncbi:MAG: PocR ligand-binding domain-containing protein [Deltaproteobacteria bacterium]|nr:PocR ligand-binding domain-containing protein [Deltaproteobacteria bacterium]
MERKPFDESKSLVNNDESEMELSHILDIPAIQSLMDDFFSLTQIGVAIIDIKGTVLVATGWQDICTKFHRVHPETARHCVESDTLLSRGVEPGTFKLYRCKNQMWDMATPIIIGGKHLGNLFLGQFFFADEEPDRALFRDQARTYGFDEKVYLAALERVPRWEREKVNLVMTFYSKFARLIGDLSHANVGLAKVVRERDALLRSLKESERHYRGLVAHSNDIIWEFDMASQKFTFASDAVERILGYSAQPETYMKLDEIFSRDQKGDPHRLW